MLAPAQTCSLYRSFWRGLSRLPRLHRSEVRNLQRLYRPQFRAILTDGERDEKDLRGHVERTLSLLASSPRLASNLASLTYHHAPSPIRGAANGARLAHLPKPIVWDPKDPTAARKAWDKREKDQLRDPVTRIGQSVDGALRRMWEEAEGGERGVWLGRVERARYGQAG
ncbi:hypothetical protein JCM10449v2_000392 [Rhodotorula kratochvilovae]